MGNVIPLRQDHVRARSIDKRIHPRIDVDERLYAQVISTMDGGDNARGTVACRAVNLSLGGLQFASPCELKAGTRLDLWIDIASRPGKFLVSADVRWCRREEPTDGSGTALAALSWQVGVQLRDSHATDYQSWREYVSLLPMN